MGERDPRQIVKFSGKTQFFEIMANCLEIEKLFINFVQYDDGQESGERIQAQVQFYLDIWDAHVLAKDIFSGRMSALAKKSRTKAEKEESKYPHAVFGRMAGVSAKKLKEKGKPRKDGMSLARQFKITPGNKLPWILSGESGPGEENEQGLIVPRYKRPEQIVRVGLDDDQFKKFAAVLEVTVQAWMARYLDRLELDMKTD